jgi:hypothetical protein
MSKMLDLIRKSEVPAHLMQAAARGSLSVPSAEMIEILVFLALHNKLFGEKAQLTLAGWDEKTSSEAASDPNTSPDVLEYFASPAHSRTCVLPALAENRSLKEESLEPLAASGSRSIVEILLASERVKSSRLLLEALASNGNLRPNELETVKQQLAAFTAEVEGNGSAAGAGSSEAHGDLDAAAEAAFANYLRENAPELTAQEEKPFEAIAVGHDESTHAPVGVSGQEKEQSSSEQSSSASADAVATETGSGEVAAKPVVAGNSGAAAAPAPTKKHANPSHANPSEERRDSTLMKISKLDIKGRIALAMRGSKEDRSILIRDATKLVCVAVLDSPKLSDSEVEGFALQKNVLEAVLRAIPLKRKFAKNYTIMRNLVFNPRTPLDLSLGLMKNLLIHDLRNLSGNKEVSETIRKLALRMYKQKNEKKD